MSLKTLFFGSIGVLVETSDIQRESYNQAFLDYGLDWNWDKVKYRELLKTFGGKNRIHNYSRVSNIALTKEEISKIHQAKTDVYEKRIKEGGLIARDGIVDLIFEARSANIEIAMVSSTSRQNISAIFAATPDINESDFAFILDGSCAQNSKPAPDIYKAAMARSQSSPDNIIVIEDSPLSAQSALAAGLSTCLLPGEFVKQQDSSAVSHILSRDDLTVAHLNKLMAHTKEKMIA